jgi:hypothetical protein
LEKSMPVFANIAVGDGTVTRTFVPIMFDKNGTAWWEEQGIAASAIGNYRLSAQLSRASNPAPGESSKSRVTRVKWTLHAPGLETLGITDGGLTAPPTLAYVDRMAYESILSERGTASLRTKERTIMYSLLGSAVVSDMTDNFAGIY